MGSERVLPPVLTPAERSLLRLVGQRGGKVLFVSAPRARWRLFDAAYVAFNGQTFRALEHHGLIDNGNGHTDPTAITDAGRHWLAMDPGIPVTPFRRRLMRAVARGEVTVVRYGDGRVYTMWWSGPSAMAQLHTLWEAQLVEYLPPERGDTVTLTARGEWAADLWRVER